MRNFAKCFPVVVLCIAVFCARGQNKSPQPAPSPSPSPSPAPGGDTIPVVGDSSWSTSPFSGAALDPSSPEGRSYGNVLNRYHVMKAEEAWLQYIKACGSAEDIKSAEERLKTATAAFNQALENYIYGYSGNSSAAIGLRASPENFLGPKQLSGKNSYSQNRTTEQQKMFDSIVSDVLAQLAKDDKQEPYPAQCPPKSANTLPAPNSGSGPNAGGSPAPSPDSGTTPSPSASPSPSPTPSPSPSPGGAGGSVKSLIGIVLPADTRPGDTATATVVKDPQSYAGVPGLRVVQATVPLSTDAQGEASLSGLVVNTGDGQQQPASQPLRLKVPATAAMLSLTVSEIGSDTPMASETVPLTQAPLTPESAIWEPSRAAQIPATAYQTVPAEDGGAVQAIHGPVSGDSSSTQIQVDGKPSTIVAESPRAVYWELPDNVSPGAHKVTVAEDEQVMSSFRVAVIGLKLSADQLRLLKGQSTTMHATVEGANAIPASAWQPGFDSDLVDPKSAEELLPSRLGSTKPAAIVLKIENKSGDAIKLPGAKANVITLPLEEENFSNGADTVDQKIQSTRSGGFNVTADVTPLLAPISGEALAAPAQSEQTATVNKRSTVTTPALSTLPTVKPPAKLTAAELSHIDAYYVASTHTLHVWNAEHFLQGIKSGKFPVAWTAGATTAKIRETDGSAFKADVIAEKPDADNPPDVEPKIGDVKFVEKEQINSVAGSTAACQKIPALFSDKQFVGRREVHRHYTELVNTGDDSGTETYQSIARYDFYDATDCTSGYTSSSDTESRWVLTVGSWRQT